MARVAVFGMGYVGCVTAGCLSQDGHSVVGVDVDPAKVKEILSGQSPISEPGLSEIVAQQVAAGQLTATDNVTEAVAKTDIALIAVGTPSASDGSVALAGVEAVVRSIGKAIHAAPKPYCVVIRSTLLPGILEEKLAPVLYGELGTHGALVKIYNNPEFLRESSAVKDYYQPPYILVGTVDNADPAPVFDLYRSVNAEQLVSDTRTASLVKYACNAYHAVKISFANEIGTLAQALG
ncbi:MAG: UDP-glucose/GDP-mannose dehydrogenase family protein, partial [Planctomycetes bacterium]|nr:UDP-glucose/GDP-mannose dehydrogenase family protein [Planctomycetota bacterium]